MGPTPTIGYLLQHLCAVLAKQSDQALQEQLGIGLSQFKILRVLQHSPESRQRQIADWLGQTEASVSRQIKLMVDKGLLRSTISPQNRREHLTTPTSKGLRMTEEALTILGSTHATMFEALGEKKQNQLLQILKQMHAHSCPAGQVDGCYQSIKYNGKQ